MKKMTLKMLLMSLLMIFVGWQSFAGTTDSVFVLANNKVQFDAGLPAGDSAVWYIESSATPGSWTELTTTTGVTFAGAKHGILRLDNTYANFAQPSDSLTIKTWRIAVQIVSAGGCISDDSSYYVTQVLPYLGRMPITWNDSSALCANNSVQKTLTATKPALTGSSSVSINDITWWVDSTGTSAPITAGTGGALPTITVNNAVTPGTSALAFMTPTDYSKTYLYHAEATYKLSGSHTLIVSSGSSVDGHSTSRHITIHADQAPTAPSISGSSASGW